MKITIDSYAGFCFGVENAIDIAEKYLTENKTLLCLGELVHNEEQMQQLYDKGLKIISENDFEKYKGQTVLTRAHGIPPETYDKAKANSIHLIDTTCPIVSKLQKKILNTIKQDSESEIVIFGKENHPEMIGLIGFSENKAIAIESESDIEKINFKKRIYLFSQTTMDGAMYNKIAEIIKDKAAEHETEFVKNESLCNKVSNRAIKLKEIASQYDAVIFVSGKNSSNGKYLYSVSKSVNEKTYFVSNKFEIDNSWFTDVQNLLITGANSTPIWLLEDIGNYISDC